MIATKYSEGFNEDKPLSEYPRPQFVRDSYFSLNGVWNCEFSYVDKVPEKYNNKIVVPYSPETPLSGVNRMLMPNEYLFYQKTFTLPENFNKGRVFINFGAVDQVAVVILNGSFVGKHSGGYLPFSYEITKYIKNKKPNHLVVKVRDATDTSSFARGKQKLNRGGIWYSPQSGIWQSVWLESTPFKYLNKVKIVPDFDRSFVDFKYYGPDNVNSNVTASIYDGDKCIVKSRKNRIFIKDFKPWSPENPFLYKVKFEAYGETIWSYFGMRKFSTGIDAFGIPRLFLNNKPYFHNGVLDQGYYPEGYLTPPSNQAMEDDILFVKEAGFNMIRKHIKIEPLLWYYYCDVHGIIVWQDMVNGGGKYGLETSVLPFLGIKLDDTKYSLFHRDNQKSRQYFLTEVKQTVKHLYNCPCIAVWVPFNEGWGQFDSNYVYRHIREYDRTRTIDTASGWHDLGETDVISKHIYFTPIRVKAGDKPYVLSEFGGISHRVIGHTFNDKMFGYKFCKSKMSLTQSYEKLYNNSVIPQIKNGLSAAVYTQLTDVEDELNGLRTYDRKVDKIDINTLKHVNAKVGL